MGFDRSALLTELGGRARLAAGVERRCAWRWFATAARRGISGRCSPTAPTQALALVDEIVRSETGPLLIDAVASQEAFLEGLTDSGWTIERPFQRMRFGRADRTGRRTAVRRRRPGIWIGISAMHHSEIKSEVRRLIADGTVLPAHPLALDADRKLDTRHQRALTRYYIDAGAGGLAVGVHTTQFAIRDVGLYRPVLELAAETAAAWTKRPLAMVAGLAGPTQQAVAEAKTARGIGYHAGLLSLAAMKSASEDEIIAHCEAVAREIPLVGFYLQPAVGGVILSAISGGALPRSTMSSPSRSRRSTATARSTCCAASPRPARSTASRSIPAMTTTSCSTSRCRSICATRASPPAPISAAACSATGRYGPRARSSSSRCAAPRAARTRVPADLLALDARVTDCNSAFFDVANNFHGCIAGCHEILRRQGLMQGIWCLDPAEGLSPGQMQEIDRVCREHADLVRRRFRRRQSAEMAGMTSRQSPSSACATCARSIARRAQEFLAVSDVTMDVQEGELISLVGPSGCGKTTVLKILAGLHDADGGTIKIGNADTPFDPARDIGMVFQQALLLKWRTILDNVLLPAEIVGLPMKAARDARARPAQSGRARRL